jgi:hypothetical protein
MFPSLNSSEKGDMLITSNKVLSQERSARFEVLTEEIKKIQLFWDMTSLLISEVVDVWGTVCSIFII